MATTVTSSIGTSSRDYSTLQAWEDACPANLVTADQIWRGEVYNDSEFTGELNISGVTTDATRYIELTTAAGQSFMDDSGIRSLPLRYDQSKGVGVSGSTSFTPAVESNVDYTRIGKLQIKSSGTHAKVMYFRAQNGVAENCICYGVTSLNNNLQIGLNATVKNFVVYGESGTGVTFESSNGQLLGSTIVKPGTAGSGSAINSFAHISGNVVANCALFNYTSTVNDASRLSNFDYCVTDLASPGVSSETGSLFSKTFSSQFENVTSAAAGDWRVKTGADLLGAGLPSYSGMLSADITGLTRANPSTIGAWESGATVTVSQEGARFYNDDGSESASTAAAAQDTNITAPLNANKILRAIVDAAGDPASASYTLRYQKNGSGGYVDVPVGSGVAEAFGTVTFGGIGTGANGSTTVAPQPASPPAGAYMLAVITSGSTGDATPTAPDGTWTLLATGASTDGTYGVDAGPRRVTVFGKEAAGTEGTTAVTFSISGGGTCRGTISHFTKAGSGAWDVTAQGGNDSTSGTGFSATLASMNWNTGDATLVAVGQRVDSATQSSQSLTASGVTFGTRTNRATTAVTTGNDHRHVVDTFAAISSTSDVDAAPTWAYTASASVSGGVVIVRLREYTAPVVNEFFISPSSNIAGAGVATTARLTAPAGKTSSDFTGGLLQDDGNAATVNIAGDFYTELAWCLQAQSPMAVDDYVEMRIYTGGIALDTYTVTPRWTVGAGDITGGLNITLDGAVVSAAGTVDVAGAASVSLDDLTVTAAGSVGITGTLSVTLDDATLTGSGTATSDTVGDLSVTLDAATLSATGSVGINGTLSATLDAVTTTADGAVANSGALSATLDAATLSATATLDTNITGDLSATLDATAITGDGAVALSGALDATLDAVTAAAEASAAVNGDLSAALADVTLSASGAAEAFITGDLAATVADVAVSADANTTITGTLSATLDTATLVALASIPANGDLAATLDALTVAGSGTYGAIGISGDMGVTLDAVSLAADASSGISGTLAAALEDLNLAVLGSVLISGDLAVVLDDITLYTGASLLVLSGGNARIGGLTLGPRGTPGIGGARLIPRGARIGP